MPPKRVIKYNPEDQCLKCLKYVRFNQNGLCCDYCHNWFHLPCLSLKKAELSAAKQGVWMCKFCYKNSLPFHELETRSNLLKPPHLKILFLQLTLLNVWKFIKHGARSALKRTTTRPPVFLAMGVSILYTFPEHILGTRLVLYHSQIGYVLTV